MALLLIEKTTGELLVPMDWSSDFRTLEARVQQILATNTGGKILTMEQGHRLILLTTDIDPSMEDEAMERLQRLLPHAERLAEQPFAGKLKRTPFRKLEEMSAFELWFKDLKMEDPELNRVVLSPLYFKPVELLAFAAVVVLIAILIRGVHVLIPHPLIGMILFGIKLPMVGIAVAMCLVIPLWGGYFRQPGLIAFIQALCYFCTCILGSKVWMGNMLEDAIGALVLGCMGYLTGMLDLVTHETIFKAALLQVFSILVMFLTLLMVAAL